MNNLLFGILTVVFCTGGFVLSWRFWRRERYQQALWCLVLCGIGLRLFVATDWFLHPWDERYHALVAKHMITHPLKPTLYETPVLPYDHKSWVSNHIWVHKQPMPLWLMAGSMGLWGVNELALRLPSLLMSSLGIWLMFLLGKQWFNRETGYLAALLYSLNGLILELTGGRIATDHVDIAFLFFVQASVWFSLLFAQRNQLIFNVLAGACLGAAILSKWLPALIVLPIWLLLVYQAGKLSYRQIAIHFGLLSIVTVAFFLPWQLYIHTVFPVEAAWEGSFNVKHLTESLEGQGRPWYFFINRIRINYGELIYLPLGWFLWRAFQERTDWKRWALVLWFWVPFLFFSAAATKMQGYLLFTAPALFLMTAECWLWLREWARNRKYRWIYQLVLILLIALPARYALERAKPFEKRERNPAWVKALKAWETEQIERGVLFNYPLPVEAMFYTNLTVYSHVPDLEQLVKLQGEGYTLFVADHQALPEAIQHFPGLTPVSLPLPDKTY